jgi:hypothetical protein
MKNIFYILLLLPTIIFAQYPSNSGQKITLGEQTTADGLVWRGRTSDTANLMTNKLDTSVYLVLDTMTEAMWLYRVTTTPKWNRVVDSLNNMQGTLSVAKGGTNRTTMPAGYILHGDDTSVDTSNQLFYNRTNNRLALGSINTLGKLDIRQTENNTTVLYMQRQTDSGGGLGNFLDFKSAQGTVSQYKIDVQGGVTQGRMFLNPANGTTLSYIMDAGDVSTTQNTTGFRFRQYITTGGDISSFNIEPSRVGDYAYSALLVNPTEDVVGSNNSKYLINLQRNSVSRFVVQSRGNVGVGTTTPTALLHLAAGTATASTAPLKFTSGVALTTPEVGAIEFSNISGTNRLLISPADNVRKEIAYTDFSNTTGTLAVANGGTGQTTLAAAGINTGNGTINFLPKYTATGTTLGNSAISDNGTTITATNRSIHNTGNNNFIRVSNYFNIGGSGSDYGSIGFNIGYTNTNDSYKYLFGDLSSAIKFNAGGFNFLTAPSGLTDSTIIYTERMRIANNGEVLIAGTTDRGAYNLQVNGTGVWGEGAYVNGSDANIKENIVDLDSSLNIVNNLKPVIFNYINTSVNNDTKHLGFIAQDVYQTLANKDYLNSIVRSDGETLSIAYSNLIPLLTKAIQEQNALIKALEQRILILENK